MCVTDGAKTRTSQSAENIRLWQEGQVCDSLIIIVIIIIIITIMMMSALYIFQP